jgi:glycosyltransferase involved in cell wall biosynthesis
MLISRLEPSRKDLLSPALLSSGWPRRINNADADIVNLHWVNGEMLSISDIAKIKKPIVWTLHDMWLFCGAEHYVFDDNWKSGYENLRGSKKLWDLNRSTWRRKRKYWCRQFHIVTPSTWLAECVKQSPLFQNWPVHVIHNPIDVNVWKVVDKATARRMLNLPENKTLILFCAFGGINDERKGFDLLNISLYTLQQKLREVEMVVIGQSGFGSVEKVITTHFLGHLNDDISLSLVYNAADVLVLPSRLDNLPNVAVESMASGTPVVSYNIGGMPDIVTHGVDGYLAKPFDTDDFVNGITYLLGSAEKLHQASISARKKAEEKFSSEVIAKQYSDLYESIIQS